MKWKHIQLHSSLCINITEVRRILIWYFILAISNYMLFNAACCCSCWLNNVLGNNSATIYKEVKDDLAPRQLSAHPQVESFHGTRPQVETLFNKQMKEAANLHSPNYKINSTNKQLADKSTFFFHLYTKPSHSYNGFVSVLETLLVIYGIIKTDKCWSY